MVSNNLQNPTLTSRLRSELHSSQQSTKHVSGAAGQPLARSSAPPGMLGDDK